jgi:hypothetical protein
LLKYGWPIDPAESNRGRSNAGPSLILAWTNLAGKHGWRLKHADTPRSYGLNLVPFNYRFTHPASIYFKYITRQVSRFTYGGDRLFWKLTPFKLECKLFNLHPFSRESGDGVIAVSSLKWIGLY